MAKNQKPICLFNYDMSWPKKFELEASNLKQLLSTHIIDIQHFGSTSIPNMIAREDLDILLVIDQLENAKILAKHGYDFEGELNIPLRYFFSKKTSSSKVNLHVCEKDHGFISLNLTLRDYFREHPEEAKKYTKVKEEAFKTENAHQKVQYSLSYYDKIKNRYLKNIIDKSHHTDLHVNFCAYDNEWEGYHRIKNEQIFKPIGVTYDPNHPTITDPNHIHFCLYHGSKVIGIAHLEMLTEQSAALRPFALDTPYQKKGHGKFFLLFLEKWLKSKKIERIHLHANVKAITFYQKMGYQPMPFNDPGGGLPSESLDMAKSLVFKN